MGGRGGRRALDSDLNMVPMIDLLMVTISFLLITAVWSSSARLEADAHVPGTATGAPPSELPRLHVDVTDPARILLRWSVGATVTRATEIPRDETRLGPRADASRGGSVRFAGLSDALGREWREAGSHQSPSDPAFDELVLHTADDASYAEIVGLMDAAYAVKRSCGGRKSCPAFRVVFASR